MNVYRKFHELRHFFVQYDSRFEIRPPGVTELPWSPHHTKHFHTK